MHFSYLQFSVNVYCFYLLSCRCWHFSLVVIFSFYGKEMISMFNNYQQYPTTQPNGTQGFQTANKPNAQMNLASTIMEILKRKPGSQNDPLAAELMNAINTGDNVKGENLARSLCERNGVTVDEAMQRAMNFFGIRR